MSATGLPSPQSGQSGVLAPVAVILAARESERISPLGVALAYQDEIAKLKMQLIRYRRVIEDAGLEPPDDSGEDLLQMWEDARAVIREAQNLVANLGTSKELLSRPW